MYDVAFDPRNGKKKLTWQITSGGGRGGNPRLAEIVEAAKKEFPEEAVGTLVISANGYDAEFISVHEEGVW